MQVWVNIWVWFSVSIMQKPTSSLLGSLLWCWAESFLSDSHFVANSQQLQLHQWAKILIDTNLAVQKGKIDGSNKDVSFSQASTSLASELVQHRWNWVHGSTCAEEAKLTGQRCPSGPAQHSLWFFGVKERDLIIRYWGWPPQTVFFASIYFILFCFLQASQLGVYRAFVDNYEVAMETAEKCCQANAQFAEISEVMSRYSDTWAVWIWLILCDVAPVYPPSTFAALTSGGVVSSCRLTASAHALSDLYIGLTEVIT